MPYAEKGVMLLGSVGNGLNRACEGFALHNEEQSSKKDIPLSPPNSTWWVAGQISLPRPSFHRTDLGQLGLKTFLLCLPAVSCFCNQIIMTIIMTVSGKIFPRL